MSEIESAFSGLAYASIALAAIAALLIYLQYKHTNKYARLQFVFRRTVGRGCARMFGKALCLASNEHYAEYCSQLQTTFLMMGCPNRRMTSDHCFNLALDYTSWCSCDRPTQKNYEFVNVALASGSWIRTLSF